MYIKKKLETNQQKKPFFSAIHSKYYVFKLTISLNPLMNVLNFKQKIFKKCPQQLKSHFNKLRQTNKSSGSTRSYNLGVNVNILL